MALAYLQSVQSALSGACRRPEPVEEHPPDRHQDMGLRDDPGQMLSAAGDNDGMGMSVGENRQQIQYWIAFPVARRQPHPDTGRNRNHRPSGTAITRLSASVSTAPLARIMRPRLS